MTIEQSRTEEITALLNRASEIADAAATDAGEASADAPFTALAQQIDFALAAAERMAA
jgi:hypothetical protein